MPPRPGSRWRGRARTSACRWSPGHRACARRQNLPPLPQPRSYAAGGHDPQAAYWTEAVRTTSFRKCRLRSCAVRRSTRLPPSKTESSASIPASASIPGVRPGSNSTKRSTSLSALAVPFNTDPNRESCWMWLRLQSAANAARSAKSSSCTWISPHHAATALRGTRFTICSASSIIIRGTPTACSGCRLLCSRTRTAPNCPEAQSDCLCCHRQSYTEPPRLDTPPPQCNIAAPQHNPRGTGLGD